MREHEPALTKADFFFIVRQENRSLCSPVSAYFLNEISPQDQRDFLKG